MTTIAVNRGNVAVIILATTTLGAGLGYGSSEFTSTTLGTAGALKCCVAMSLAEFGGRIFPD